MTTDASFSIQDVLESSIYYFQSVHESIEPTSDVFSFYVSDGFSQSEVHSMNITIQVCPCSLAVRALSDTDIWLLKCSSLEPRAFLTPL